MGLRYETYKDKYTDFLTSSSWMANEDAFIPRLSFIYTPNDA
ncbi:hypothetical protein [Acinetobacter nectaris]